MIKTLRNAWKLPELRNKILFVIFALLIFRLGAAIPVPYINTETLQTYMAANSGTIFGLLNTLSGSALSRATLFALSIQPYINASIIIQLLTIAIPALERLAKDGGEEGKKKDPGYHPVHHAGHRPASGLRLLHPHQELRPSGEHRFLGRTRHRPDLHRRCRLPDVAG